MLVDIQATDTENDTILKALRAIENQYDLAPDQQARIFVATVLSGHQLVTDYLMNGCAEFITKPLEKTLLFSKLNTCGLLARKEATTSDTGHAHSAVNTTTILNAISRRLKTGTLTLPPAPKIAMRLRQLIDCDAEINDVVDLLKQDPAIATKLISVSNSAFYRGIEKNTTLAQAASRLGFTRTREVVMSICCRGYFSTNHPVYKAMVEKLWWHSLACAHTAEMVVRNRGWSIDEDLFSIGLLHDIGKLLLLQGAGDMVLRKHAEPDIKTGYLQALMAEHHARLGADMQERLNYPPTFVSLVQRHHHAGNGETASRSLRVVQQANLLAKAAGVGLGTDIPERMDDSMEELGISAQMKGKAIPEIARRMENLRYLFG